MGQDKAGLIRGGETLLARTARIAQEAGCRVCVIGRAPPDHWPRPDVEFVGDTYPDQGPLGGLATALETIHETVLLLACDMPLLNADALGWLIGQERAEHGLAVRHGGQWEPLFSVYTPSVLTLVRERLAAGRRSLQSLIDAGDFRAVSAPPHIAAALVNVNTPEDLTAL